MSIASIFDFIIGLYKEAPLLIQIGVILILLMFLTIIALIISLKIIRYFLKIKDNQIFDYKKEYEAFLIDYLYSGDSIKNLTENQISIIQQVKEDISSESRRKAVITILSNLMNEVSGEMSESIKRFYYEVGLTEYAYTRVKSNSWHITAKAISELRRFEVQKAQDLIYEYIDHPRVEIRNEAQLFFVHIFKFKGLSFLNQLETPISEWHQLLLLETLSAIDEEEIGDLESWLKSPNTSVVLFALKLTKIYNQFEMKNTLIELLSHNTKEVRKYTTVVLSNLFGYRIEELLKFETDNLNINERIAFIEHLQ